MVLVSGGFLGKPINPIGVPIQDEHGRTTGTDRDLAVDDTADGEPVTGEPGRGQGTFDDPELITIRRGDVDWLVYRLLERPVLIQHEQADVLSCRTVPVSSSAVHLVDANPNRMSIEIHISSLAPSALLVASDQFSAESTNLSFQVISDRPFKDTVTCDLWVSSPDGDQSIFVKETFRSGQAQGYPVGSGGR